VVWEYLRALGFASIPSFFGVSINGGLSSRLICMWTCCIGCLCMVFSSGLQGLSRVSGASCCVICSSCWSALDKYYTVSPSGVLRWGGALACVMWWLYVCANPLHLCSTITVHYLLQCVWSLLLTTISLVW
jgi:hypothetical protein